MHWIAETPVSTVCDLQTIKILGNLFLHDKLQFEGREANNFSALNIWLIASILDIAMREKV